MVSIVSIICVVGIFVVSICLASFIGIAVYRFMRHPLYNRPMTSEELWAETSHESEDEFAGAISDALPR